MRNTLRVLFCCFFVASSALAAQKPAEIGKTIQAEKPYGHALYRALFMRVYDADLWANGAWSWDKPFALTLIYHMGFDSEELIDRSIDEMRGNSETGDIATTNEADYRHVLASVLPDVSEGDRITALYMPGKSLQFFHNGKLTGTSHDMQFAKSFLGIWLSEGGSNPAFTNSLTHGK